MSSHSAPVLLLSAGVLELYNELIKIELYNELIKSHSAPVLLLSAGV